MSRFLGKWAVGISFVVFLILEVWFSWDKSAFTWPLTHLIVTYVPYPVIAAVIGWFIKWAPKHFDDAYRKEGTMKSFKFEPVKWMTIILGVLVALSSVQMFMDILPDRVQAAILIVIAVLTAILGAKVHGIVTPTADPRDDTGRRLVPVDRVRSGEPHRAAERRSEPGGDRVDPL